MKFCWHDWLVIEHRDVSSEWRQKVYSYRCNYTTLAGILCFVALVSYAIWFLVGEPSWAKPETPAPWLFNLVCKTIAGVAGALVGMILPGFILCAIEGEDYTKSCMTPPAVVENMICRKCRKPVFGIEEYQKKLDSEAQEDRDAQELDAQLKADFENYKRLRKLMA